MTLGTPELVADFSAAGDNTYRWMHTVAANPTGSGVVVSSNSGLLAIDGGVVTTWNAGAVESWVTALGSDVLQDFDGTIYALADGGAFAVWFAGDTWVTTDGPLETAPDQKVWGSSSTTNELYRFSATGSIERVYTSAGHVDGSNLFGWGQVIAFDPPSSDLIYLTNNDPSAEGVGGVWVADQTTETYSDPDVEPHTYWTMGLSQLYSGGQADRQGIAVHGDRIYFSSFGDGVGEIMGVHSIPKGGGTATLEFSDVAVAVADLAVVDGYLYGVDETEPRLLRWSLPSESVIGPTVGYIGTGGFMG